jgi:RHS repeat-associated protein
VTAVQGAASAAYTYDGNLKRVKSVVGANTVYTVYSRAAALVYREAISAATSHTSYIDIGPAGVRIVDGVPTYTHADSQGSPVAATDASGAVAWRERYTPFGETLDNPAGNAGNKSYTGYLRDAEFALLYAQARYYDPAVGRFLEPDPQREADQINLYAYVGNNPTNNTDPTGLAVGDPFDDPDSAGLDAVLSTNSQSIATNGETGGFVVKGPDGKFRATQNSGSGTQVVATFHGDPMDIYGDWHDHGDYSTVGPDGKPQRVDTSLSQSQRKNKDQYDSDNFSGPDKGVSGRRAAASNNPNYHSYLGTPGEGAKIYDPKTGKTTNAPPPPPPPPPTCPDPNKCP